MKRIAKKVIPQEEAQQMFAEVSLLRELDHPNIMKLFELFQDDDNYYLISEWTTLLDFF